MRRITCSLQLGSHSPPRARRGLSLTRAIAGIAIVGLAASIFFPAFQVQYAAARRAAMAPDAGQIAGGQTAFPDAH